MFNRIMDAMMDIDETGTNVEKTGLFLIVLIVGVAMLALCVFCIIVAVAFVQFVIGIPAFIGGVVGYLVLQAIYAIYERV